MDAALRLPADTITGTVLDTGEALGQTVPYFAACRLCCCLKLPFHWPIYEFHPFQNAKL